MVVVDPGVLATVPLFDGVSLDQRQRISEGAHLASFPAGTTLIVSDGPGDAVYIVLSGTVKVHVPQSDGRTVILEILGPGEVLGEMSVIDDRVRSASVVALTDTTCLWFDAVTFRRLLATMDPMDFNLLRLMIRRVRLLSTHVQTLTTRDIQGRVACQLLAFAEEYGEQSEHGTLIPIRLIQSDLADLVGASRVRVNRVIGTFRERGAISVDARHQITIHDFVPLRRSAI